eukprot:superscaffoldBa00008280_g23220
MNGCEWDDKTGEFTGFNHYGYNELPSVSLLQKTPSSPVSCHATGFYPHRAEMFWRKDGEKLHEDVDHGEILPNHDGTFQMSVDLNLSSVTPEDWRRYECVFHLSGVKDDIVTKLDKAVIRTNWEILTDMTILIIAVVALAVILIAAAGFMFYKKKKVIVSGLDAFTRQTQCDTGGVLRSSLPTKYRKTHNKIKTATGLSAAVIAQQDPAKSHAVKTMELVFLLIFFPVTLS